MVVQFLDAYELPRAVPSTGCTTHSEIANNVGLEQAVVKRFLRHAMMLHIFDEDDDGKVIHTALSRRMASNPRLSDAIKLQTKELAVASSRNLEAIRRWGNSANPNQTSHNLAFGSSGTFLETLMQDPTRVAYFGGAMQFATSGDSWDLRHIQNLFDWSSIDKPDAVAVDVGGGLGHISMFLAEKTTNLTFIV
jgi:hypothetical protein